MLRVLGQYVRSRSAYVIKADGVVTDEAGEIIEIIASIVPNTVGENPPEGMKPRGVIHWVSAEHSIDCEVRLYDRLFSEADPDGGGKNFLDCVNPQSLQILQDCKAEQSLLSATAQDHYQFEREGYFCLDSACVSDGEREGKNKGKLVFNRTIGLRDNWQQKK